ncbi:MAG: hypothetical protein U5N10_11920 [Gemmobacter sp.]|nr:hypothetical protein [Gemmobacter sp.]
MTADARFVVSERNDVLLVPQCGAQLQTRRLQAGVQQGRDKPAPDMITLFVLEKWRGQGPTGARRRYRDADNTEIVAGPLKGW